MSTISCNAPVSASVNAAVPTVASFFNRGFSITSITFALNVLAVMLAPPLDSAILATEFASQGFLSKNPFTNPARSNKATGRPIANDTACFSFSETLSNSGLLSIASVTKELV